MDRLGFLDSGGETGELIRNYDWETTPLGKIENWPFSLKSTVGIVLHSAFPQYLFWGKDLITFYNDPLRPSLGNDGKHPAIGKKGKDIWPEIWDFVGPLIEKVMTTGEAVFFEDQLVPFNRNGRMEDVYFTFSYSPAYGDDGKVAGVFVTCPETTSKVETAKELNDSKNLLQFAIEAAELGTWELNPSTNKFRGNSRLKEWFGLKPEEEIELTLATNVIAEKDREKVNAAILKALTYESGGHYDIEYTIQHPVTGKETIVKAKGKAYFDDQKKPYTFSGTLQDITQESENKKKLSQEYDEQKRIYQQVEESEAHLQLIRNAVPAMIFYMDAEQRYRSYNGVFMKWFNVNATEALGKTTREFIGEAAYAKAAPYLEKAYSGERVEYHMHAPKRIDGEKWLNIVYTPHKNPEGQVIGIIVHATDITEHILALKKIEKSEALLGFALKAGQLGSWQLDLTNLQLDASENCKRNFGQPVDKPFDYQTLLTCVHANDLERQQKALEETLKSGKDYEIEYRVIWPNGTVHWVYIRGELHKNSDGQPSFLIGVSSNITERKRAEEKIQQSEIRFRNLLQEAPVAATLFKGPELVIEIANEMTLKYWGKDKSIIGKPLIKAAPELEDQQMVALVRSVYENGGMQSFSEIPIKFLENGIVKDGKYSFSIKALYDTQGNVESVLSTGVDVSEQVKARQQIEQSEKELRNLINASPIGICVVSGDPVRVEEVNEKFLLISGKTREQFAAAPYWEVISEVAHIFEPVMSGVFKTGIKYTTEENEMVLVRNGVPEKISITFEYVPVFGTDNKVSKVIVMAVEVTHQVETRKKIEEAVIERTKELAESNLQLKRSNQELEQFAYIASHDLQEPVRKISTFAQMLELSITGINEKSKDYISKIHNSTDRMTKLIRDVLAFSRIKEEANEFEKIDLNKTVDNLITDYELAIEETEATIETNGLPTLEAVSTQMTQLFGNLLSNSLKYRKSDVKPIIKITSSIAKAGQVDQHLVLDKNKKYFNIEFSDNGIGFDKNQVDRIFRIFQRLHGKTEFEGTGIGLAICLRIVQNHQGHISAAVGENGGAVFNILLPQIQDSAGSNGS